MKPRSEFYPGKRRKDGLNAYCIQCVAEWKRESGSRQRKRCKWCGVVKSLSEFAISQGNKDGIRSVCLDCHRPYNAKREAERRARADLPLCACGCGERVRYPGAKTRHGHYAAGQRAPKPLKTDSDGTDQPKKYERASKRTHRRCSKCGEVKPRGEFDLYRQTNLYGYESIRCASYCKLCAREMARSRRAHLSDEEIARRRECNKRWREQNKLKQRNLRLIRDFGITLDQYEELKQAQEGRCAICGSAERPLVIDHCHSQNRVRGLLCGQCNSALGLLSEDENIVLGLLAYVRTKVLNGREPRTEG
jgi:hypothetical protein